MQAEPALAQVQPHDRASAPFACIPAYLRAFAFPLALPRTAHARNVAPADGAATKPWCAPDRTVGMHRLVGKRPVRRRIAVAVLFSLRNL